MSADQLNKYIESPLPFEAEINKYYKKSAVITIFEIGSCEGEDSIRLRRSYPAANIYTFEPLPGNIQKIKDNLKKYAVQDIELSQIALSNKNGSAKFYVSSGHPEDRPTNDGWDYGNKSSSLLKPKKTKQIHKWLRFKDKIKVKTQRLDTFCNEHSLEKIDFIFLDVQGAELKVLEGAGSLIKNIGMIWLEVEAVELYKRQPLKNDVERFMKTHGFECIKSTVDDVSGDQLYVKKGLTPLK